MRRTPGEPGEATGKPQPAEIDDGFATTDRGEIAEIAIAERTRQRFAGHPCGDDTGGIGALLLGDGRHARQRPVCSFNLRRVADYKDLRMTRQGQIGPDRHSAPRPGFTPSQAAAGEAATPAAQITVRLS